MEGIMNTRSFSISFLVLVVVLGGCAGMYTPQTSNVSLTGPQEVPPVGTSATGAGQITVTSNRLVSGTITVFGMEPTAAHIHTGEPGVSGPPIITLNKSSDNTFTVPAGSMLTESQYAAYQAGNLYVNVHSPSYPAGEVRAQLKPQIAARRTSAGTSSGY
jgi:hypothetical protein